MESSARDDSALADAASSAPDPYEYVIPEARSLSSSDNESEKESPSQYRMEQMRKRDSDGSQSGSDGQSSSGDEEVEIPEDEIPPDEFDDEDEQGLFTFFLKFLGIPKFLPKFRPSPSQIFSREIF